MAPGIDQVSSLPPTGPTGFQIVLSDLFLTGEVAEQSHSALSRWKVR